MCKGPEAQYDVWLAFMPHWPHALSYFMQVVQQMLEEVTWDGEGDDALVETDEEEDVIVLGDPALIAADADKVTALAFVTDSEFPPFFRCVARRACDLALHRQLCLASACCR